MFIGVLIKTTGIYLFINILLENVFLETVGV